MRYPDSVLEEIRSRADLVDWIGRYVELKRAGANFKGLCPFHQEKSPSFMVSAGKAIYKCFGCGAGGNLFTFIRDVESVSFSEAVRRVAKETGVDLTRFADPASTVREAEGDRLYKINDEARHFFIGVLASEAGLPAREYLAGRGLTRETMEEFSLGYAPDSWDALLRHLSGKGYSEEDALHAGLAKRGNERAYDAFRRRVIFPILNLSGSTCGFSARILGQGDEPKYLNSPETAVYKKGSLLYGLPQAREALKHEKKILLVEGNLDLITLHQGGIKNAVASTGTAFTDTQAHLIKRFCDEVLLVFDGDEAGQKASLRGLPVFINAGLLVRVAALPPGEDPDSFFKKSGREGFLAAAAPGKDAVDFSIDRFAAENDLSVPENKAKLLTELSPLLLTITDPVLKSALIKKIALRTGTREELVIGRRPAGPRRENARTGGPGAAAPLSPKRDPAELRLVELALAANPEILSNIGLQFSGAALTDPVLAEIYNLVMERGGFDPSALDLLTPPARETACGIAFEIERRGDQVTEEEIGIVKNRFKIRDLTPRMSELKRLIFGLPDGEEKERLMREHDTIRKTIGNADAPA